MVHPGKKGREERGKKTRRGDFRHSATFLVVLKGILGAELDVGVCPDPGRSWALPRQPPQGQSLVKGCPGVKPWVLWVSVLAWLLQLRTFPTEESCGQQRDIESGGRGTQMGERVPGVEVEP